MVALETIFKDGLDGTMIDTWQQCRRKFYNRFVRGLDVIDVPTSLIFGQAIHKALEKYLARETDEAQSIDLFAKTYPDKGLDDRRTTQNGENILNLYFKTFPRETDPFEVLSTEVPFKMDIGAKVPFSGRRDVVVKDKLTGKIWIMDHKTTTAYGDGYAEGFEMHTALDGYILDAAERFGSCEGAIINVLVVQKTKPRCERFSVLRSPEQLAFWKADMVNIINEIVDHTTAYYDGISRFTLSRGRCKDYNRKCVYFDLCKYCDNQEIVKGDFTERSWSPFTVEN